MRTVALIVLVVLLGVADRGVAQSYDEHDYCLDSASADRVDCNAEFYRLKAAALSQRAFDRWIESEDAESDYLDALADAVADRFWCRSLIDTCLEE